MSTDSALSYGTNPSAAGMMASALRQARSCKFTVFYWAHDVHLWDGTIPFAPVRRDDRR